MAKGNAATQTVTLADVVERLDMIARLMVIQMVNKDVADMKQKNQIKLLVKHGLANKEVADLLNVLPSNVSHGLKK